MTFTAPLQKRLREETDKLGTTPTMSSQEVLTIARAIGEIGREFMFTLSLIYRSDPSTVRSIEHDLDIAAQVLKARLPSLGSQSFNEKLTFDHAKNTHDRADDVMPIPLRNAA